MLRVEQAATEVIGDLGIVVAPAPREVKPPHSRAGRGSALTSQAPRSLFRTADLTRSPLVGVHVSQTVLLPRGGTLQGLSGVKPARHVCAFGAERRAQHAKDCENRLWCVPYLQDWAAASPGWPSVTRPRNDSAVLLRKDLGPGRTDLRLRLSHLSIIRVFKGLPVSQGPSCFSRQAKRSQSFVQRGSISRIFKTRPKFVNSSVFRRRCPSAVPFWHLDFVLVVASQE